MQLHRTTFAAAFLCSAGTLAPAHFVPTPSASAQTPTVQNDRTIAEPLVSAGLGTEVAVDGDTLAIGSEGQFIFSSGAVHFYDRAPNGEWTANIALLAPSGTTIDRFGWSVAVEGDTAFVSEPGSVGVVAGFALNGVVHQVERVGGTWTKTWSYTPPNSALGDRFGEDLCMEQDLLLVGSPNAGGGTGAAHLFRRDAVLGTWSHEAELIGNDTGPDDFFGSAVAIADGRLFVGAPYHDGVAFDAGAVYVFEETAPATWTQTAKLVSSAPAIDEHLGAQLAADGVRVAANAPGVAASAGLLPGATLVFGLDPLTGTWVEEDRVRADDGGGVGVNPLLASVALDGDRLAVGHPAVIGVAHLFESTPSGTWNPIARLASDAMPATPLPTFQYGLGHALALEDGRLFVGAPGADPIGFIAPSGAVYDFAADSLFHSRRTIPLATGGAQLHHVRAGAAHANAIHYFVGSASGATPGTIDPVSGLTVPINVDAYTQLLINTGGGPLIAPLGLLDANGRADSGLVVPVGSSPSLAGLELHHAALLIDSTTFVLERVTNAVPLTLE